MIFSVAAGTAIRYGVGFLKKRRRALGETSGVIYLQYLRDVVHETSLSPDVPPLEYIRTEVD